jgi:hypothetical protein
MPTKPSMSQPRVRQLPGLLANVNDSALSMWYLCLRTVARWWPLLPLAPVLRGEGFLHDDRKRPSGIQIGLNVCFGLLLCLGMCGCDSPSLSRGEGHTEHHVPDHKPATFAAAIEQIRSRHERLATEFRTAEATVLARELSEMLDIVGWLTELAADSPMKKTQWDLVNVASKDLRAVYQHRVLAANTNPRGDWPTEASRVDKLIASLAKLVPFAEEKL